MVVQSEPWILLLWDMIHNGTNDQANESLGFKIALDRFLFQKKSLTFQQNYFWKQE